MRPQDYRLKLYGMTGSGNCYKPALLMRQLGIPFEWEEVDILTGGSRTPAFLARNPNGKVPLLEITDGGEARALAESNAMLCYLAEGTALLPDDRWPRAQVLQWLFFEQYSHEPYIATVRAAVSAEPPRINASAAALRISGFCSFSKSFASVA